MRNRGRMDIRHQLAFLSMSTFSIKQYTRELSNHPHWDPHQVPPPHIQPEMWGREALRYASLSSGYPT